MPLFLRYLSAVGVKTAQMGDPGFIEIYRTGALTFYTNTSNDNNNDNDEDDGGGDDDDDKIQRR